jgi:3-oxoacyl-[acyl-carrier protein] reductase
MSIEPETPRVALVTGASRGIGQAIAAALTTAGHTVIGTATTPAGAERIDGEHAIGRVLDVADPDSVDALIASVGDEFGPPLIVVNNAGITRDNLLLRMKADEWQSVIDTNLGAVYRVSRACARGMTRARWGRIVNISSVVGAMGNAGQSNYAASKAGIGGFSRALARELGPRNVTVNCVAPGFIDTDMTRELSEDQRTAMLGQIPLNRLGDAAEIAAVVRFLCSPGAAYVTGETLHVNGGMYMN